ncbi:MAG: SRPBCC family protein [Chitinophagaceae bacterium]|nr:SRPBCC family protein [Chitinophagaceae bacterium]
METATKTKITIEATVKAPVEKVWKIWTSPADIVKWSTPSPDWHTPRAEHDLQAGGKFNYRMEAKDGSFGFDFGGVFDVIKENELIEYTIGDGRKVVINFNSNGKETHIVQTFEAESQNPIEMQRAGWQAILDSFKNYTENN